MTEKIRHRRTVAEQGFALLYHVITLDNRLSDAAYRTYALLLKYAQQKGHAYPGVLRLAAERNRSEPSVKRDLKELEERGLISRSRRYGTSSMTWIEDVEPIYQERITGDTIEAEECITHDTMNSSPVIRKEEEDKKNKVAEEEEELSANAEFVSTPVGYQVGPGRLVSCVDPDTGEEVGEPDWRTPSGQVAHQAFNATGRTRLRYTSKAEFNKIQRIERMLDSGEMPHKWWEREVWAATQYSWSFPELLKNTLNVDNRREWERSQT